MRPLLPAPLLFIFTLLSGSANATDRPHQIAALSNPEQLQAPSPNDEKYRGYYSDVSQIAGRQDFATMVHELREQVDIVESVGLPPNVIAFFHTIPIVVGELPCNMPDDPKSLHPACYGPEPVNLKRRSVEPTVWDSKTHQWTNENPVALALDTKKGVVLVDPQMLVGGKSQEPILLHELLHAYHHLVIPEGFKNPALLAYYNDAKGADAKGADAKGAGAKGADAKGADAKGADAKGADAENTRLYPASAYVMKNEKEFFAVTGSVFLYGKVSMKQFTGEATEEPFTRSMFKQKQPDYYRHLVWLFGFDPDAEPKATPVASTD